MKYNVQLKVYEGPLDLLYDMISKQNRYQRYIYHRYN